MTYLIDRNYTNSIEYQIIEKQFGLYDKIQYISSHDTVNYQLSDLEKYKDACPLGEIGFISDWLKVNYNATMQPIEVPRILRIPEFLHREYTIVQAYDLCTFPQNTPYFIKKCTKLKEGSCNADIPTAISRLFHSCDKTDWFVVSEIVNISSEWRVYVINEKIEQMVNYDGLPTVFPDTGVIKKMMAMYHSVPHPKSYTIDIMVHDGQTSIIEIHPFCAVGLYSTLWDKNLLQAYRQGIDWYIERGGK